MMKELIIESVTKVWKPDTRKLDKGMILNNGKQLSSGDIRKLYDEFSNYIIDDIYRSLHNVVAQNKYRRLFDTKSSIDYKTDTGLYLYKVKKAGKWVIGVSHLSNISNFRYRVKDLAKVVDTNKAKLRSVPEESSLSKVISNYSRDIDKYWNIFITKKNLIILK